MSLDVNFWKNSSLSDVLKLTDKMKTASMDSVDFTTTELIEDFQTYVSNLSGIELSDAPYDDEPIISNVNNTAPNVVAAITRSDLDNIIYSNSDNNLNALLDDGVNLNYLMPARNVVYYSFDSQNFDDDKLNATRYAFNVTQQQAARSILNYASSVTGIEFQEVSLTQDADLHFANTDLYGTRTTGLTNKYSNYQYNARTDEIVTYRANIYVYLDNVEFNQDNAMPVAGSQGYETLLHEIGHALGLKHPFESPYALLTSQDNTNNTVMSYSHLSNYKTEFQSYDLAALDWIYGGDGLGGKSSSSVTLAKTQQGTSNDDYLVGTAKSETLTGLAGNDTLNGSIGRDSLIGGDGNDIYIVDNTRDKVIETNLFDTDSVQSSVNYTLPKNVENLLLTDAAQTGIGNELANKLVGNELANSLNGKAGDDTLEGGKGNDKLTGGTGHDTFVFNINDYDFLGDFAPPAQNIDTITDFKKGEDLIELSAAFAFKGFAVSKSLKSFTGDESLIYDTATHTLYFDADGQQTHYTPTAVIKFTGKIMLDVSDLQFINEAIA
ncbi:MAG: M10 family metallopeptidase [Methylococcales bacterium]|nr:M10 family metallopeptidase [Methylococcales bacterium]